MPDPQIITFINNFTENGGHPQVMRDQFSRGYCYHFALILNRLFPGGMICWVAPFAHMVYLKDDIPYDINGVYDGDGEHFIPVDDLGRLLDDFLRIPGRAADAVQSEIQQVIDNHLTKSHRT